MKVTETARNYPKKKDTGFHHQVVERGLEMFLFEDRLKRLIISGEGNRRETSQKDAKQ